MNRRWRLLRASPILAIFLVLAVTGSAVYLIFFTPLIRKQPPQIEVPPVDLLTLKLVSYPPPAATSSAQLFTDQLAYLDQPSFETIYLDPSGQLISQTDASTPVGELPLLVTAALPDRPQLVNLFALYRLLYQINTPQLFWAVTDSAIALYPPDTLVAFSLNLAPTDGYATLQQIRSTSTMSLTGTLVDLRFTKPVLIPYAQTQTDYRP